MVCDVHGRPTTTGAATCSRYKLDVCNKNMSCSQQSLHSAHFFVLIETMYFSHGIDEKTVVLECDFDDFFHHVHLHDDFLCAHHPYILLHTFFLLGKS
jgi:hypothetical protein